MTEENGILLMPGLRVPVCGGRNFDNAMQLGSWLGGIDNKQGIACIIHGAAPGADFMAGKFAEWKGIPVYAFPADWKKHGKAAGPIRNAMMLLDGKPDLVVAFAGGTGTANMVRKAKAAGIEVLEIDP